MDVEREEARNAKRRRTANGDVTGTEAAAGAAEAPELFNVVLPLSALQHDMEYLESLANHNWKEKVDEGGAVTLRMPDNASPTLWLTFLALVAGQGKEALPSVHVIRTQLPVLLHWCEYFGCSSAEKRLLAAGQAIVLDHDDVHSHADLYCILAQHKCLTFPAIRMRDLHLALLRAQDPDIVIALLAAVGEREIDYSRLPAPAGHRNILVPEPVVTERLCELLTPYVPGDPAAFVVETSARMVGHVVAYAAMASPAQWAANAEPMPFPLIVEVETEEGYRDWLAFVQKLAQRARANVQEINHSRTIELSSFRAVVAGARSAINVVSCPKRPASTQWHTTFLDIGPARRTAAENCVWDGRAVRMGGDALVALLTGNDEDRRHTSEHFAFAVIHAMAKRRMSVDMGLEPPREPLVPVLPADHPVMGARRALDRAAFDPSSVAGNLRTLHREHERVHERLRATINSIPDAERATVSALQEAVSRVSATPPAS